MTQIFPKPRSGAADKPEIYLAAFGKHPGWNDHIDDLGLETESLVNFKRVLYLEGISGAIESGAWDKLEADRRVDGFGHVIVSRVRGNWLVARLWSSSDGKGRTKYPMVVCVEARGVGLDWVLNKALPMLERVQSRCTETVIASVVTAVMDSARAELRAGLPVRIDPADVTGGRALAELAEHPALGGGASGREGIYRLLYQIKRDWATFTGDGASGSAGRSKMIDVRAQHARVPACATVPADSVRRWVGFLSRIVHTSTTTTVILPVSASGGGACAWADLIVGDPAGSQYFCLRASAKALPLVTEVPYSLDESFVNECNERIERSSRGEASAASPPAGVQTRTPGLIAKLFGSKRFLLVLIIALALIGTGAAIVLNLPKGTPAPSGTGPPAKSDQTIAGKSDTPSTNTTNGSTPKPPNGANGGATPAPQTPPTAVTPPTSSDADVAAWQRLCDVYNDWALAFVQRLDERPRGSTFASRREYYQSDEYLGRALQPLFNAVREGYPLDPRSIAGVARDERLAVIRKEPPASALTPSAKERTAVALRVLDAVATGLSVESWGALADVKAVEARLREGGRTKEADLAKAMAEGATIRESKDLAPGIDRVLGVQDVAASLRRKFASIDGALAAVKTVDDPEISRLSEWVAKQLAEVPEPSEANGQGAAVGPDGASALRTLDAAAGKIADTVAPIGAFVGASGTNIDRAVLSGKRGTGAGAAELSRESLQAWLGDAKASMRLSAELDPRRSWNAEKLLEGVAATREKLEKELKAKPDDVMAATEARLRERIAALKSLAWNTSTKTTLDESIPALESEIRQLAQRFDNMYAAERIRIQGSAQEVRQQLEAQRTIVSGSDAVNAAWGRERDRLLTKYTDAQFAQLAMEAGQARERLVALDDAVPPALTLPHDAGRWASLLTAESSKRRERIITERLDAWAGAGGAASDADGAKLAVARDAAAKQYAAWRADAEKLAAELGQVEGMLDAGYGFKEANAKGQSIAAIASAWNASEFARSAEITVVTAAVQERVRGLEQIEQTTDRIRLFSMFSAAQASTPERLLAAWRQLDKVAEPVWPISFKQLDEEQAMQAKISEALTLMRSPERVKAIEAEMQAARRVRWERAFAAASEAGEIEGIADRAAAFGVDAKSLTERTRFNFDLVALKQSVATASKSDAEVIAFAKELAATIRAMGSSVSGAAEARTLLVALDELADNAPVPPTQVDVRTLGPGAAGWSGRMVGDVLEFTRPSSDGRAVTLRFVRVEPPDGPVAYIGQGEVSLGQVIELMEAANAWDQFRSLWTDDESTDPRYGPRVWKWSGRQRSASKLRPSDRWQQEVFRMRNAPPDSPAGMRVSLPTTESPMNYVSPATAVYVAALAGGRLPTSAEWKAARAAAGEQAAAAANLRDETWKAQQQYEKTVATSGANKLAPEVQWPDTGIFRGSQAPRGGDATSRATTDGVLWFAPALAPIDAPLATNLIGNVAEYVMDAPALAATNGRPTAAQAMAYAAEHAKKTYVIGGSALSAPETPTDTPLPLVEPDELTSGYSDVGFRLAFSAEGAAPAREPLFGRLARALAEAAYLKP